MKLLIPLTLSIITPLPVNLLTQCRQEVSRKVQPLLPCQQFGYRNLDFGEQSSARIN